MKVNPKVLNLIQDLGVKVYWDLVSAADAGIAMIEGVESCCGFYDVFHDAIVINAANRIYSLELVLLHELGHWSGRSNRLNRPIIALMEELKTNCVVSTPQLFIENAYEEAIAQFTMYHLVCALNLDSRIYYEFELLNYLNRFPDIDRDLCDLHGIIAANYVLNLVSDQALKAA